MSNAQRKAGTMNHLQQMKTTAQKISDAFDNSSPGNQGPIR